MVDGNDKDIEKPDDESQVKKLLDKCFALLYASEEGSEDSTTEQETGQVVA